MLWLRAAALSLLCGVSAAAVAVGVIDDWRVVEASGLVASKRNTGIFWTHNDSGDYPRVFAVRAVDGTVAGEFTVWGAGATDWEDLSISGRGELCVGDMGGHRASITVYCFPEPKVDGSAGGQKIYGGVSSQTRHFTYPDGERYDAETLLINPGDNSIGVVTKGGELGSVLFLAPDAPAWSTTELRRVATVALPGGWAGAVGGDVSWTGKKVVLKSYGSTFFLFDARTFWRAGGSAYRVFTQWDAAESVAFAPGSESSVYTLSEGSGATLFRYDL